MFKKKNRSKKRTRAMLSAYSIIMILIILLGILSHVLPKAQFALAPVDEEDAASVEVGPGEWEGEMPAGGPAVLNEEAPAEDMAMPLSDGESVAPVVGDDVTPGEEAAEPEAVNSEVAETEAVTTVGAGEEAMLIATEPESEEADSDAAAATTYDSLEACEEENGEGA